jgi:hypothetical protein
MQKNARTVVRILSSSYYPQLCEIEEPFMMLYHQGYDSPTREFFL